MIEILAVAAIIVVLVGVLAPVLGAFGARNLSSATDIVTANLHETRAIALGETTPTRLAINADLGNENYMRALTILKWQKEVDPVTGGVTGSWVQAKPWAVLPENVIIELGQPIYVPNSEAITYGYGWLGVGGEYFTDTATYATDGMPGGQLAEGETPPPYVFIEYKPSGNASVYLANGEKCNTRNIHLILTEGIYNAAGAATRFQSPGLTDAVTDPADARVTQMKNWAHVVTDSVGGRIKNFRP